MSLRAEDVGDAVVLTLDRPERKNAIDRALARLLGETIRIAASDPRTRGIVVTASGDGVFAAGGDLREFNALIQTGDSGGREVLAMLDSLSVVETCDVPVIAAVQGDVMGGGCELLLLCDFVILEEHTTLSFRHVKMGLLPAWGGMSRLVERVGPLHATRLLMTADIIDAAEAVRIGLANEVVPKDQARERAISKVNRIADNPRTTIAAMKRALYKLREAHRGASAELEREAFSERWGATDHRQAMDAFMSRK